MSARYPDGRAIWDLLQSTDAAGGSALTTTVLVLLVLPRTTTLSLLSYATDYILHSIFGLLGSRALDPEGILY